MKLTSNYNLKKPEGTDIVNINDLNDNADIIDTQLKNSSDHSGNKNNPHGVTKSQVGLASVLNYDVATQTEAEAGTSNAKYMTPLRTKQAITKQLDSHANDYVAHPGYANTTGTNAYSVTLNPKPTALVAGLGVVIKVGNNATANCTLNVNGLGVKPIVDSGGKQVKNLKAGGIYSLRYGGTSFILQGEGGVNPLDAFPLIMSDNDRYEYGIDKINLTTNRMVVNYLNKSKYYKQVCDLTGTILYNHELRGKGEYTSSTDILLLDFAFNNSDYRGSALTITDFNGNELCRLDTSPSGWLIGYDEIKKEIYTFNHDTLNKNVVTLYKYDNNGTLLASFDFTPKHKLSSNTRLAKPINRTRYNEWLLCEVQSINGGSTYSKGGAIAVNTLDLSKSIVIITPSETWKDSINNKVPFII